MIQFDLEEDYLVVVTGGPWRVLGSILMVQAWSPTFDPLRDEIVTTPVWVRISNLPVNFYHRAILMGIAEGLGKPIRVDLTTLRVERARFARVCIEVNLKKPLKGSVMVNGEWYYVSYEGLNVICPSCGVFGHLVNNCPRRSSGPIVPLTRTESGRSPSRDNQVVEGFTEVRRSCRRSAGKGAEVVFVAGGSAEKRVEKNVAKVRGSGHELMEISNSFCGLEVEVVEQDTRRPEKVGVDKKENEGAQMGLVSREGSVEQTGKSGEGKGIRGSETERRTGGTKAVQGGGSKGKGMRSSVSTRGLVFGPLKGEVAGMSSGKRLRVDDGNVGRLGGVFSSGSRVTSGEASLPPPKGNDGERAGLPLKGMVL